jgi:hypothetical protein
MDARFQKSRLIAEVELYLAVVEVFRGEGCDPHWSAEPETPVRAVEAPPAAPRTFAGPG